MARAKDMSRADARRRTREQMRGNAADDATAEAQTDEAPAAAAERPRAFKMPDVRADLRALPSIFRSRRLLWLPLLLLVVGLAATLALPGLSVELGGIASLFIQFFFLPPALFTFFIAGFLAPRASYLVGLIYGLIAGTMWSIVILTQNQLLPGALPQSVDALAVVPNMLMVGGLYGTLAAAFAAWYRDFLRGMQERGRARRADKEAQERARRRDQRQESRRAVKRPSP